MRATEPPFTAPLSGATCIWHQSIVQPYLRWWYDEGHPVVETRSLDLLVEDDTGSALVHMQGADVNLVGTRTPWCYEPPLPGDERNIATTENVRAFLQGRGVTLRYKRVSLLAQLLFREQLPTKRGARYREALLREGDWLAVLGRASQEPDPATPPIGFRQAAFRLVLGDPPDPVIASNASDVWS